MLVSFWLLPITLSGFRWIWVVLDGFVQFQLLSGGFGWFAVFAVGMRMKDFNQHLKILFAKIRTFLGASTIQLSYYAIPTLVDETPKSFCHPWRLQ